MTPKLKKIIITVVIIGILFIVYVIFIKKPPANESLVANTKKVATPSSEEAKLLGGQISQALLRIEQITLDKSIFVNDIYKSLKDRSQPIKQEPVGRPNPFAPLDASALNSINRNLSIATTTATTTAKTRDNLND